GVPYAFGLTLGTLLQSIFLDVLLVMSAPLARRMAPHLGKYGTAKMATAMAISLECGIVLMVPGVATLALAGLLSVPLGKMLIFGLIVIVPTIMISIAIMNFFIPRGLWKIEQDQESADDGESELAATDSDSSPAEAKDGLVDGHGTRVGLLPHQVHQGVARQAKEPPLILLFTPMLLALVLIASGAMLEMVGLSSPRMDFLSSPVIALLISLLGTSY
ncbi:gluconate permease, partial [Kocuria subflava]|nr:gluconate permease [Kocuria subflava]